MNIYLIKDESTAVQLAQLLKLNSECVKLHWSRTIKNIPSDVSKALETIESFVETRVLDGCSNALFGELNDDEEALLMDVIRKKPELRATLGLGVVLAGKQADEVKKYFNGMKVPKLIIEAINSGKNAIIF